MTDLTVNESFGAASGVLSVDIGAGGASSNVATSLSSLTGQSAVAYATSGTSFSPDINQSGVDFSQTFSSSNIVASGSTDSVRLYRVTRSDNTVDEFALLIPGEATQSLSYVTYGQWNSPNGSSRDLNFGTVVFGVQTAAASMPTTGTATYDGLTVGTLNIGSTLYNVGGFVELNVNFASGSIDGGTDLLAKQNLVTSGVSAWRTLVFSGTITGGTNLFAGTAASDDTVVNGSFNGGFFGPVSAGSPPEIGGGWSVSGGNETAIGGFVGKR